MWKTRKEDDIDTIIKFVIIFLESIYNYFLHKVKRFPKHSSCLPLNLMVHKNESEWILKGKIYAVSRDIIRRWLGARFGTS